MKISLKLQDQAQSRRQNHRNPNNHPPLLLLAKIPITIFNLPVLSHFSTTTTHPSDLSLSLSTNCPSFPSLKLSYAPAAAAAAAAASPDAASPLTLTLKSGTGVFGSPNSSPLVISAHFSFNPSNPAHPNPTFSLFFKPKLGSFSLRKSTSSHPEPTNGDAGCDSDSFGFVPLERPATVKDLSPEKNEKDSILKGTQLAAMTQMPLSKRVALNFRWRVNFAEDQMPVLRINKIGLHRIDDDDALKKNEKKKDEAKAGEVEALKGMFFWMRRELDVLTRANRAMKCELEEMKAGRSGRAGGGDFEEPVEEKRKKKAMPSVESPSQWRSTRNGLGEENGNGKIEERKKGHVGSDVENELQRAIKAAATAAAAPR